VFQKVVRNFACEAGGGIRTYKARKFTTTTTFQYVIACLINMLVTKY